MSIFRGRLRANDLRMKRACGPITVPIMPAWLALRANITCPLLPQMCHVVMPPPWKTMVLPIWIRSQPKQKVTWHHCLSTFNQMKMLSRALHSWGWWGRIKMPIRTALPRRRPSKMLRWPGELPKICRGSWFISMGISIRIAVRASSLIC